MEHVPIQFYLDENLSPEIAKQLARHGIDVIRGPLRADDLQRANALGRVLCAQDKDFTKSFSVVQQHAGIIKGYHLKHNIGSWIRYLRLAHGACTPNEMRNKLEYVFHVD